MKYRKVILIIEDEKGIGDLLSAILRTNGYKPLHAMNGKDALLMRQNHNPDLILLDLGLPDMDGMDVLREIRRQSETPVIVISARQDESDKVTALDGGASDYIVKPFGSSELLARIRAMIRLHEKLVTGRFHSDEQFQYGGLQIDYTVYQVAVDDHPVHLTPIEYKIVELLAKCCGKVLTHEQIIGHVWGPKNCDSQVLRVNMANIRRKIEKNPADPQIIITELGIGYRLGTMTGKENF